MAINVKEIEQSRSESGVLYLKAQEAERKEKQLAEKEKRDAEKKRRDAEELDEIEEAMSQEIYPEIELEIENLLKQIVETYPKLSFQDVEILVRDREIIIRKKQNKEKCPLTGNLLPQLRNLCNTVGQYEMVDQWAIRNNRSLAKALSKNNNISVDLNDGYYEDYSSGAPDIGYYNCSFIITIW